MNNVSLKQLNLNGIKLDTDKRHYKHVNNYDHRNIFFLFA